MAEPPRPQHPHGDDTSSDRDGAGASRVAPWQIVVGVVGLLVVLGIAVLLLAGDHGPGRHAPADDTGQAPVSDHDDLEEEIFEGFHGELRPSGVPA